MTRIRWLFSVFVIATLFSVGWVGGHISSRTLQPAQAQGIDQGGIDTQALENQLNLTFIPADATIDTSQVKISKEDAIARAQEEQEGRLKGATSVTAELGYLSSPGLKELAKSREQVDSRLVGNQLVWVVNFEGIESVSQGLPSSSTYIAHEYNAVIDATTGEFVIGFVYR